MKKIIIVLALLVLMIACIFWLSYDLNVHGTQTAYQEPIIIGFSLGATREERWFVDRDFFVQKAQELGAVVSVTLSDYDVDLQSSQIENLASQGAKVIVIVPADSEALAPVIAKVKAAGVKIIAYDRLIKNSAVDFYLSFDNVKVGELEASSIVAVATSSSLKTGEALAFAYLGGAPTDNNSSLLKQGAMEILEPKIKSGEIKLVIDEFMEDWKPDEAYKTIKNYLAAGGELDAIVAANDGIAFGAIQALEEQGLAGKIPVSGQDAELAAYQRIFAGTQTSTVYKPISLLAYKTAEIAVAMANGRDPEVNNTVNNGWADIPSFFIDSVLVTRSNLMGAVINDGFHTYEEVYKSGVK
ncbi:MAG: sugar ABC transporter substrate-binding protein [Candidatus Falkowbacteria bacterium]|nr:sugar ABC transporter substrate-binding protein [Candidatus Falkowbacteria bacterium]